MSNNLRHHLNRTRATGVLSTLALAALMFSCAPKAWAGSDSKHACACSTNCTGHCCCTRTSQPPSGNDSHSPSGLAPVGKRIAATGPMTCLQQRDCHGPLPTESSSAPHGQRAYVRQNSVDEAPSCVESIAKASAPALPNQHLEPAEEPPRSY